MVKNEDLIEYTRGENTLGLRMGILHKTNAIERCRVNEMWEWSIQYSKQDENDSSVFHFNGLVICIGNDDKVIQKTLKQFIKK